MWVAISESPDLDAAQVVQLTEACRAKDRLDRLDQVLRGDVEVWSRLVHSRRSKDYVLRIDAVLAQANATANTMKQLLAALRLPDETTGRRPQYRGPRGALGRRCLVVGRFGSGCGPTTVPLLRDIDGRAACEVFTV